MNLVEILIISIGLSLDVYAVVVCQGAVLLKIERMKLLKMSLIFCAWQVGSVLVGHSLTLIPFISAAASDVSKLWQVFSVVIFMALAVYMLYKAWKREPILERLSEINYKHICVVGACTGADMFFAGLGFGFLDSDMLIVALSVLIVTAVTVTLGLYTGYRLGYEQKTKAYGVGGVLLLISAFDVIFRYI